MDPRHGASSARPDPGRFRCLVCQTVVTGTASGHCPRCAFVPPSAMAVPEEGARGLPWTVVVVAVAAILALVLMR